MSAIRTYDNISLDDVIEKWAQDVAEYWFPSYRDRFISLLRYSEFRTYQFTDYVNEIMQYYFENWSEKRLKIYFFEFFRKQVFIQTEDSEGNIHYIPVQSWCNFTPDYIIFHYKYNKITIPRKTAEDLIPEEYVKGFLYAQAKNNVRVPTLAFGIQEVYDVLYRYYQGFATLQDVDKVLAKHSINYFPFPNLIQPKSKLDWEWIKKYVYHIAWVNLYESEACTFERLVEIGPKFYRHEIYNFVYLL